MKLRKRHNELKLRVIKKQSHVRFCKQRPFHDTTLQTLDVDGLRHDCLIAFCICLINSFRPKINRHQTKEGRCILRPALPSCCQHQHTKTSDDLTKSFLKVQALFCFWLKNSGPYQLEKLVTYWRFLSFFKGTITLILVYHLFVAKISNNAKTNMAKRNSSNVLNVARKFAWPFTLPQYIIKKNI